LAAAALLLAYSRASLTERLRAAMHPFAAEHAAG